MSIFLIILGGCLIGYGVSVMAVGSGTGFFLVWYVIGGILLAIGFGMRLGITSLIPLAFRRVVVGLCIVTLMALSALSALSLSRAGETAAPNLNYLIVLGAQVKDDGPSEVLRYRLDVAREYLLANPATRCIVSGGRGPNEPRPEADVMYDYLIDHGVEADRILKESESTNTVENFSFSAKLLNPHVDTVGIVTNDFHVYRALRIARAQGYVDARGLSAGSVAWYLPNNVLREDIALVKGFVERTL